MKNSTKALATAVLSLLAACGGSSNAALSKSFNYGAPTTPTTTETAAATSAQGNLSQTTGFSTAPDATKGAAIIGFADELAASLLGGSMVALGAPASDHLSNALRTAADFSTCSVSTANSVTFHNCTQTESGFTVTLNGSVTVSGGLVTWGITGGFSGTDTTGMTINIVTHQNGSLNVTSSTIKGDAISDFSGSVSGQGQNVNFGLATAVLLDLSYQSSPSYCVTSGTAEVKRVWTARPQGATGLNDAGVKFTWTGCNAVQVAHSM